MPGRGRGKQRGLRLPPNKLMSYSTPKVKPAAVETSSLSFPTCRKCSDTGFIPAKGGVRRCDCRNKKETPNPPSLSPSPSPVAASSIPSDKAKNQRQRMIAKLEEAGEEGVTNREFIQMGIFRYSSRLHEIRKKRNVKTIHVRGGLHKYVSPVGSDVPTSLPGYESNKPVGVTANLFAEAQR